MPKSNTDIDPVRHVRRSPASVFRLARRLSSVEIPNGRVFWHASFPVKPSSRALRSRSSSVPHYRSSRRNHLGLSPDRNDGLLGGRSGGGSSPRQAGGSGARIPNSPSDIVTNLDELALPGNQRLMDGDTKGAVRGQDVRTGGRDDAPGAT